MLRICFIIAATCLLGSAVWFLMFSGFSLLLEFGGAGGFISLSGGFDLESITKIALVVGVIHGLFIAMGIVFAKPGSLASAVLAALVATEVLLLVLLVLWGSISLASNTPQITIGLIKTLGSNLATVFLILSLIFLIPTAAIAFGVVKGQGLIKALKQEP